MAATRPLASRLATAGSAIELRIDDEAPRYPLAIDPLVWIERQKLLASDGAPGDQFGTSVSVSGDTAVVEAFADADAGSASGSAYVFVFLKTDGEPCAEDDACLSGLCVDGVCCDSACGGGLDSDCQACSVTEGAAADGVCGPSTGNSCDDGSYCNGVETCSAGICGSSAGDPCPGSGGDADCAESCDEATDSCIANDPDGGVCHNGTCQSGACEDSGGGGANGTGGCGCRVAGGSGGSTRYGPLALLGLMVLARRRRRRANYALPRRR